MFCFYWIWQDSRGSKVTLTQEPGGTWTSATQRYQLIQLHLQHCQISCGEEWNYLRRKKKLYITSILQILFSVFCLKFISKTHQKCSKFVLASKRNHPKPAHTHWFTTGKETHPLWWDPWLCCLDPAPHGTGTPWGASGRHWPAWKRMKNSLFSAHYLYVLTVLCHTHIISLLCTPNPSLNPLHSCLDSQTFTSQSTRNVGDGRNTFPPQLGLFHQHSTWHTGTARSLPEAATFPLCSFSKQGDVISPPRATSWTQRAC